MAVETRRWEEVVTAYQQALAARSDLGLRLRMARVLNEELSRQDESLAEYRSVLAGEPDNRDAIAALERSGKTFEFPVHWGMDLQSEHERWLTEEHVKAPVVVVNYPKEIKAFYMRMNDDGKTVAAMDVLAPGIGEIIGGSQREERLEHLDRRLAELKLDPQHYWWYRDLRRYGTFPHAGFGLGLERTIIYATGMANIRDVIPFPRTPGHAAF